MQTINMAYTSSGTCSGLMQRARCVTGGGCEIWRHAHKFPLFNNFFLPLYYTKKHGYLYFRCRSILQTKKNSVDNLIKKCKNHSFCMWDKATIMFCLNFELWKQKAVCNYQIISYLNSSLSSRWRNNASIWNCASITHSISQSIQ